MEATTSNASIPSANHASCRRATPPPARPTCRLASVLALRMTRPTMAPSNGQSTFCSRRRSMPPSTLIGVSPVYLGGGDLLEEDRVEDLASDGRRHLPALAAALHQHDHDDFRILHRGEGGEPRVVLPLVGLGVRDHLRRAGLARDVEARNARAGAGAVVVDDRPQALAQEGPHGGVQLDVTGHRARVRPHDTALRALDALHETRLPQHAAVGDRGHEARDLHRGHEHLPLADRHVDDLAGLERRRPAAPAALRRRDEAELLGPEIDAGRLSEAERGRVLRDGGATDLEPGLIEEDVARVAHRIERVHGAVPFSFPVLERPRAQLELAVAVRAIRRCERLFLQARGGHDDLEDGARRVLTLDRPVQHREFRVLHHAQPGLAVDGPGKAIDLERRRRDHGQHVAIARIHDHPRAGVALHRLLGRLLDASIDGGDDLRARMRLRRLDQPHRTAHGVDLDALTTVLAAQELVEQSLEPALSDHVAATVAALLELIVAGFADVPEQMSGEARVRIDALRLDLDDDTGQLELPLLDLLHL